MVNLFHYVSVSVHVLAVFVCRSVCMCMLLWFGLISAAACVFFQTRDKAQGPSGSKCSSYCSTQAVIQTATGGKDEAYRVRLIIRNIAMWACTSVVFINLHVNVYMCYVSVWSSGHELFFKEKHQRLERREKRVFRYFWGICNSAVAQRFSHSSFTDALQTDECHSILKAWHTHIIKDNFTFQKSLCSSCY